MTRSVTTALGSILMAILSVAMALAAPRQQDVRNIETLAGCFEVTYEFVEDGEHDTFAQGSPLRVREWVGLRRDGKGSMTLPHVSITPDGRAVPHWYEVWTYRPEDNAWTQEVWRDFPGDTSTVLRYECTAPWMMNRWQCHAGKAPKPFRDSGAPFGFDRADYAWLDRENILLVTDEGWVHNEHNKKVDSEGTVIAHELGWITYERIAEQECRVAIEQYAPK